MMTIREGEVVLTKELLKAVLMFYIFLYSVEMGVIETPSELGTHTDSTVRSFSFGLKPLSLGETKQQ